MKNKVILPTLLFVAVLAFSFYVFYKEKEVQSEEKIILFYGEGCPHCAIVDKYLEENNITELVKFSRKEVYYNQVNAKQLKEKAKACGMPSDSVGVPFLWAGGKCFVGDREIINYFNVKKSVI